LTQCTDTDDLTKKNNQETEHTIQNNATQKVALVNSTTDTLRKKARLTEWTESGLLAFYIRPGNRAGLFLQPRSPHGAIMADVHTTSSVL